MINLDHIIRAYEQKNYHLRHPRKVKTGKEAMVFMVEFGRQTLALKVYIDPQFRSFQNNSAYLEGKYYRKPSERKAVLKRGKFGRKLMHRNWVRREFYLLKKLNSLGANVPKVYDWTPESILMEFIGDEHVAPRLTDVILTKSQAQSAFQHILHDVKLLLQCGVVHGDLSAYNILWWQEKPYIIDLPQAVDIRHNPHKDELLKRDLQNLFNYFAKYFEIDEKEIITRFDLT